MFKYLHSVGEGSFWLDHRLVPEVRAMFCAMASRAPVGGIQARYAQVVEAVAESLWDEGAPEAGSFCKSYQGVPWYDWIAMSENMSDGRDVRDAQIALNDIRACAEDRLCEYPLHPKVQKFFDDFVGKYGHCYDDQTDVLARVNGRTSWYPWPKFCDLHSCGAEVEVAAFDPALDGLRYEKPLAVIRKPYSGKMYRVGKQRGNIDLLVTPEHTMLVRKRMYVGGGREAAEYEWSDWRGVRAEEVAGKTTYRYKRGAARNLSVTSIPPEADPWGFSKKDMLAFGRLCGFFVGDGYAGGRQSSYLSFNLRKDRELAYLADLVRALGLDVIDGGNGCQHVSLTGAREWAQANFYAPEAERTHKKGWDTRVPEWVMHAPEAFVLGFLDGMRNSDGSDVTESSWSLSSVSGQVMEAVQVLGTMWGCPVSVRGPYVGNEVRTAFVSGPKCQEPVINRNGSEDGWEDYDGEVFCATTSTGFLVVRRNYATVVSGNSSIMELTGEPAVYSEGISWFTAWQLFDSPLCAGQEFSTRAVQHADWPMARECNVTESTLYEDCAITVATDYGDSAAVQVQDVSFMFAGKSLPNPQKFNVQVDLVKPIRALAALHKDWFEVFEAEVAWWKEHLSDEANRLALGIGDKEPFRPALDRARWALPGTIATGCAHTTGLRERARVLKDGANLAAASNAPATQAVWDEITETYRKALPGLAGMGLREAVYTPETVIPGHMRDVFSDAPDGPDAEVELTYTGKGCDVKPFRRKGEKSYLDVSANSVYQANVTFRCSLAVARDWHRHRTLFPWHLQVVRGDALLAESEKAPIQIDHHYQPMSDLAKAKVPELLARSTRIFDAFMATGNVVQAALALPLGTRVRLRGQGGLRDVIYMLELRKHAVGANFEYKEQATTALDAVRAYWTYPDGTISDAGGFGIVP